MDDRDNPKMLMGIYDYLHKKLLEHDLIMADKTHYKIYGEKGKKRLGKTYMWIYKSGPYVKHRLFFTSMMEEEMVIYQNHFCQNTVVIF